MFNFKDCLELLTLEQQMNFHYEFKKQRGGKDVYETRFAYTPYHSPAYMLQSAFAWDETTQGDQYWRDICQELFSVMDIFEFSSSIN